MANTVGIVLSENAKRVLGGNAAFIDQFVAAMAEDEIKALQGEMELLAQKAVQLDKYLMHRGAAGHADVGHDKAWEYSEQRLRKVRRTMNFLEP